MGLFGNKKKEEEDDQEEAKSSPTSRSRQVVKPVRKSQARVRPRQAQRPRQRKEPETDSLDLDVDSEGAPTPDENLDAAVQVESSARPVAQPPEVRQGKQPITQHQELEFTGDLKQKSAAPGQPSRSGDAPLLEFLRDKAQLITAEQGASAVQKAKDEGLALDVALTRNGSITETDLVNALTQECWIPHLKVDKYDIRQKALKTLSLEDAQSLSVLPVDKLGSILNLAMVNPLDEQAVQIIEQRTGLDVKKVVATRSEIDSAIHRYYGGEAPATPAENSRTFEQDLETEDVDQMITSLEGGNGGDSQGSDVEVAEIHDDFVTDIDDLLGGEEVKPTTLSSDDLQAPEPAAGGDLPATEDLFEEPAPATEAPAPAPEPPAPTEPEPVAADEQPPRTVFDDFDDEVGAVAGAEGEGSLDLNVSDDEAPKVESDIIDAGDLFAGGAQPPAAEAPSPAEEHVPDSAPETASADAAGLESPAGEAPPRPAAPARGHTGTQRRHHATARSATQSFKARASDVLNDTRSIVTLVPVNEEDFQHAITHGRMRAFEKWVSLPTRNRVLNAAPIEDAVEERFPALFADGQRIEV